VARGENISRTFAITDRLNITSRVGRRVGTAHVARLSISRADNSIYPPLVSYRISNRRAVFS